MWAGGFARWETRVRRERYCGGRERAGPSLESSSRSTAPRVRLSSGMSASERQRSTMRAAAEVNAARRLPITNGRLEKKACGEMGAMRGPWSWVVRWGRETHQVATDDVVDCCILTQTQTGRQLGPRRMHACEFKRTRVPWAPLTTRANVPPPSPSISQYFGPFSALRRARVQLDSDSNMLALLSHLHLLHVILTCNARDQSSA